MTGEGVGPVGEGSARSSPDGYTMLHCPLHVPSTESQAGSDRFRHLLTRTKKQGGLGEYRAKQAALCRLFRLASKSLPVIRLVIRPVRMQGERIVYARNDAVLHTWTLLPTRRCGFRTRAMRLFAGGSGAFWCRSGRFISIAYYNHYKHHCA